MNSVSRKLTLGLGIAAALFAAACGDKVTVAGPPTPTVHSVTVSPPSTSVSNGASFTFGASVDADAAITDRSVTWSSSNTAVAAVSAAGVATAASVGVTSVCAISNANTAIKGCATLTVTPAAAVRSVSVSPSSTTVAVGGTAAFNGVVTADAGITDLAVTWTSSVTTVASVSATGVATALAAGSTSICAASHLTPAISSCGTLTVVPVANGVHGVIVSPSTATVAPAGTFQFGAAVDADATVSDRSVTWSSSNTAVATVSATGLATALNITTGGQASICAASNANNVIKSCAQLNVSLPQAVATVSIGAITRDCDAITVALGAACGLATPVAVNNVFGQIDVLVTVTLPAGNTAQVVKLNVVDANGVTQDSYTQTATSTGNLSFPVQTAKYDPTVATATGAKVFFPNGQWTVQAVLVGSTNTATSSSQTMTFRNANGFHVSASAPAGASLTAGNNQNGVAIRQTAGNGFAWTGGTGLQISAIAVSYTGQVIAAVTGTTVNFGSACDLFGARGVAATSATAGVVTGTLTYANGAAAAVGNLNGYAITPGGACGVGGEVPGAVGVDATGNPFINFALGGAFGPNNTLNTAAANVMGTNVVAPNLRMDNLGPSAIAGYNVNPNGRAFGWFNGAVQMNVRVAAGTPNGAVAAGGGVDAGIGGATTLLAHAGTAAQCNTVANCATTPVRVLVTDLAPAALTESATGASYGMVVQTVDLFGNVTNPAAVNPFGVDVTAPTNTVLAGPAANAIIPNVNAAPWTLSADDATATVGAIPSGIVGPNNITVSTQRRDGASTQFWCPANAQFQPAAGACASWAATTTNFVQGAGAVNGDPPATNNDAYYGIIVSSTDNAGNTSTTTIRNLIKDATVPAAFGPNFLPAILPAAGVTTFAGSFTDNLDGARGGFGVNYPLLTGGATMIRFPWSTTGAGAAPGGTTPTGFNFAGPSVLSQTFNSFQTILRSVEQTTGGNAIQAATNATSAVNQFQYFNMDVARNLSNLINTGIGFGSTGLVAGNAFWSAASAGAPFNTMTWQVCTSGAPAPCAVFAGNIDVSGNAAGANVNSRVLQAVATSGTNPWSAPFIGGVTFYVVDIFQPGFPGGVAMVPACTSGPPVNDQVTNSWIYSCTYTPSTLRTGFDLFGFNETTGLINAGFAVGQAVPVVAVGFNTTGNGLSTVAVNYIHQP